MNDPEIRALLYPTLVDGVYVDELPTGNTRVDVVHITDEFMHGYEIKGDGDTMQRVVPQLRCYAPVYDLITFIVTEKHLPKLLPLLPTWVGVMVVSPTGLMPYRTALYNSHVERSALAALLLLEEVKQFLLARGLDGVSTMRRQEVMHYLRYTGSVPLSHMARYVRERLTARLPDRMQKRAERKAAQGPPPPRKPRNKNAKRRQPATRWHSPLNKF